MTLDERCLPIRLILSDVDGVLTDGRIIINNQGLETKRFHVRDGMGIHLWQMAGRHFGLITLRTSQIVKLRVAELGIGIVRQGVQNKQSAMQQILAELQLTPDQACYIGDDLPDLSVVRDAGLGVAVADACDELRKAAHFVTTLSGGAGAVRETIELILKSQNLWNDLIQAYLKA
jgi:3-deoxy-D-manno-octulosonate 8-phosphate phosphatase (KDO 8-P phosphatase)